MLLIPQASGSGNDDEENGTETAVAEIGLVSNVGVRQKRKKPVSPFDAAKHWLFSMHSNGLEPLTFGSVVCTGVLLRF